MYSERKNLYDGIEEIREKPLITYVTSSRNKAEAIMGSDSIIHFMDQINLIPEDIYEIDLLIVSQGGDAMVAWRMISLLREKFDKISVLLPYEAFSAATLIALGADEIIMHPFSNLGPVDPQITKTIKKSDGSVDTFTFGAEDITHYLKFIKEDVGLTDQEQLQLAFTDLVDELGAHSIGFAKRSTNLTVDLGEKLLKLHMKDDAKVNLIISALSKEFFHHGFALGPKSAISIGLNVIIPENNLKNLMWDIWLNFMEEMEIRYPFNPIELFKKDLLPNHPVNTPHNVEYELFQAALESNKSVIQFRTKGNIIGVIQQDSNINLNIVQYSSRWI